MKFKIGDRVKVRKDLEGKESYGGLYFSSEMEKYRGMIATITGFATGCSNYLFDISANWEWNDEMLEEISEKRGEEPMRFEVGNRVRTCSSFSFDPGEGIIEGIEGKVYKVHVLKGKDDDFRSRSIWHYYDSELEKISSRKTKKTKKGGIMSLLKKLLKPADALIDKYAMTSDGNLDMDNVLVQQALLNTDDFKKKLVELCKEKEKEEKEK